MSTHCDNRGRSSRSSSPGVDSDSGSKSSRTEHDLCSKFTSLGIVPKNNQTPHPPASNYPQYQSLNSTTYLTRHSPPRGAVPSDTPNPHYSHNHHHQPSSKTHASQGRPASGSRLPTQLPSAGPVMSPVDYEPPAELSEPTIKKKRKRADARQLKVLNATYSRTAFPSTQEREPLAKALDMSARSVQIWFQNKRQAIRQGGRNVAAAPPPEPTPSPPAVEPRGSPVPVSPMIGTSGYSSRSPPPGGMRSGQTPSPSGRSHADIDSRAGLDRFTDIKPPSPTAALGD